MNRNHTRALRALIFVVLFAVLACAFAVSAAEKTVYLGASGTTETGDGSVTKPFSTLAAAIGAVHDGGRIIVTETYTVTERDAVVDGIPRLVEPTHAGKIIVTSLDGTQDYRSSGACIRFPKTYVYECGGDLLAKKSWKKSPQAVFSKNAEVNGVGGPSIFTSPDGKTRYILYHGYLGKDTSGGRYCFMEPYSVDADGVHIGKDGHPSPLSTVFTVPLNTMPLGAKASGFDNFGTTRVKLKIGRSVGSVNEIETQLDAAPVIRNNRTMLPARFVAESFGAAVSWDGAASTAKFTAKDGTVISIRIGAPQATVGSKTVALDTPAYIDPASGRTYLPVRFLAEALGAFVVWNGETSTAYLIQ